MANNWKDGEFGLQYFDDVNGQLNINDSFNDDIESLFTDKESLLNTTFTDKSTLQPDIYTDKPSLNNVTYVDNTNIKKCNIYR